MADPNNPVEDPNNPDEDPEEDSEDEGSDDPEDSDDPFEDDDDEMDAVEDLPLPMDEDYGGEPNPEGPEAVQGLPEDVEMEIGEICDDWWSKVKDVDLQKFVANIIAYWSLDDIKKLRLMNSRWNTQVVNTDSFQKKCKGTIRSGFYKSGQGRNPRLSIRLDEVVFQGFIFYRRHELFKKYWPIAASKLEIMELDSCSFECEGLKFLIDFAPKLQKLTIRNCKLRDLDNYHQVPRAVPVTKEPVPKHTGITSLHLEGIRIIESCFMNYLIEKIKPNKLNEFSLSKCFVDPLKMENGAIPSWEYFRYFLPKLRSLILKSSKSLKKLTCNGNPFQMGIFQQLALKSDEMNFLEPTHLSLGLFKPKENELFWNHLVDFINNRCSKLEKLNLQILEGATSAETQKLIEALRKVNCPLKTFNFGFIGNPKDEKMKFEDLISNLPTLEQLVVDDRKELHPDVKYIVGGERYWRYRLHSCFGSTPAHCLRLEKLSQTNISPDFLVNTPKELKELGIKGYNSDTNIWVTNLENPVCFEKYQNLTKLEIFGPYIYSLHLAVPKIVTLVNLESLALSKCDIQDSYITGLGTEAIMELRRCLTYSFPILGMGNSKTREDLEKTIKTAPNYNYKNQITSKPRPRLSDLPKLKYLDLSHNPQLSDVGIFDSMNLPLVETLVLNNCPKISDTGLDLIGMNFPSLKTLCVKYNRKMSDFGINEVIKTCKHMKRIYTTNVVVRRRLPGFSYRVCPSYNDIVRTSIKTESEGFISDEIYA